MTHHRKFFGLWKEDLCDDAPSVYAVMDSEWKPYDLAKLVSYLGACRLVSLIPTQDVCAICGFKTDPFGWFSDGVWLWKTSLPHYVVEHEVRLPQPLVEHIRERDYQPPSSNKFHLDDLDWPFGRPGA